MVQRCRQPYRAGHEYAAYGAPPGSHRRCILDAIETITTWCPPWQG
ncbi:hypothetical protein [Komagataeibacter saccharivorans]|nr:hypothetical protein [Komagataeibacter saccharivorans]